MKMVKILADKIFLKLFYQNLTDSKILLRLLTVAKLNDLLIIFELCKNILVGNVDISQKDVNKLKFYEKDLIFLSEKNKSLKNKINLLKRKIELFKTLILIGNDFILK